ncbi:5'-methylthioadenosine/S-adenosylhomocysteine nucleosidase [Virgibacillus sp. LDC-1]|uniref:5'-methylthioadenosine/S-adenosylhomocysteine nucleosidase n=1 Tax=Virgibacillus sp. LDC-1 TaxID=3039856 RepID=UPI0024DE4CBD|nr:5'-methylthioadenosine/S-adenosylhomocysteine nucleosidase [Virgibacillus sp. LDC-1]
MTIGIIGAMDEEIALLAKNMTNKVEEKIANCLFLTGTLENKEVVLLKSGIGKVNAAMATTIMHERYAPSHVINTGSAGGFAEQLEVGDIVISSHVVHHDVDVTAFDYKIGQVPGMPAFYQADSSLVEQAVKAVRQLDVNAMEGLIGSADTFMNDPERVAIARANFPEMIAAEMEAAAIAQVCHQYNKKFVVIRALSDIAGKESALSFDEFLGKAAKNAAILIMTLLKKITE